MNVPRRRFPSPPKATISTESSLPPGVVLIDNFLSEDELNAIVFQMDMSGHKIKENSFFWDRQKKFIVNVSPSLASRIRIHVNAAVVDTAKDSSIKADDINKMPFCQQHQMPARVLVGKTREHHDEPQETLLCQSEKDAYRNGYTVCIYLSGDGTLLLGSHKISITPNTLVAWPNNAMAHSAYGGMRYVLGPVAVIPFNNKAPLVSTGGSIQPFIEIWCCFMLGVVVTLLITSLSTDMNAASGMGKYTFIMLSVTLGMLIVRYVSMYYGSEGGLGYHGAKDNCCGKIFCFTRVSVTFVFLAAIHCSVGLMYLFLHKVLPCIILLLAIRYYLA